MIDAQESNLVTVHTYGVHSNGIMSDLFDIS